MKAHLALLLASLTCCGASATGGYKSSSWEGCPTRRFLSARIAAACGAKPVIIAFSAAASSVRYIAAEEGLIRQALTTDSEILLVEEDVIPGFSGAAALLRY